MLSIPGILTLSNRVKANLKEAPQAQEKPAFPKGWLEEEQAVERAIDPLPYGRHNPQASQTSPKSRSDSKCTTGASAAPEAPLSLREVAAEVAGETTG